MSQTVTGRVVRGHRVASGLARDTPYSSGTIRLQAPIFRSLGVDLSRFHPATINVDISPLRFSLRAKTCLRDVRWSAEHPPETFSFSPCRIIHRGTDYEALIYYPHPETKQRHFQSDRTLEILAPQVPELEYGSKIAVVVTDEVILR